MNGDIAHSDPEPPSLPRKVTIHRAAEGYGFNLHGEKGIHGQYISAIDDGSPAQRNDLRVGDRVIGVNNEDVEDLPHSKVVERIRAGGNQVTLLVVDEACDQYYKKLGEKIPQDQFITTSERSAQSEENHVSNDVEETVETMGTDGNDTVQDVDVPPEPVVDETPKVDETPRVDETPKVEEETVEENENDDGYEEVIPKTTTETKPVEIPAENPPEIVEESKPAEVTSTTTTTQISNSSETNQSSKLDMAAARPKPKRHDVKRATQNWKQKYDDFNKL